MNTCLRNRALLLLSVGEGTSKQRAHLATCTTCTTRYQKFVHDVAAIEQTLLTTSPPLTVPQRFLLLRLPWRPLAAAFVATLALVWGGVWLWQPSHTGRQTRNEEVLRFLENEVSPALFATVDARAGELPTPVSNLTYVEAALAGEWPCEQQGMFLDTTCDVYPFPLLMRGR